MLIGLVELLNSNLMWTVPTRSTDAPPSIRTALVISHCTMWPHFPPTVLDCLNTADSPQSTSRFKCDRFCSMRGRRSSMILDTRLKARFPALFGDAFPALLDC